MKRSGFQRKAPLRATPNEAKATVKVGKAKCVVCRAPFTRVDMRVKWCSPECGGVHGEKKLADQKAKAARQAKATDRAKRASLKTRTDWIKSARAAVNRYCRLRDIAAGRGCVTCGARPETRFGGAFDAGHWRSVGSAPQLQFMTSQIRLQCVKCNRFGGGRAVEFRMALVNDRGENWVRAVEAMNHVAKFSVEYLQRLTRVFTRKANRMEKRIAMQG